MAGLRVLLLPNQKRRGPEHRLRVIRGGNAPGRLLPLGRWSLLQPQHPHLSDHPPGEASPTGRVRQSDAPSPRGS